MSHLISQKGVQNSMIKHFKILSNGSWVTHLPMCEEGTGKRLWLDIKSTNRSTL